MKAAVYLLFLQILLLGCSGRRSQEVVSGSSGKDEITYARGLSIVRHAGWTEVVVKQPWKGAREQRRYALIEDQEKAASVPVGFTQLNVPLESVAATSTTHLPHFELLQLAPRLKGFANATYIYSPYFRGALSSGQLLEIGDGTAVNYEKALSLAPQAIFTFSMGNDRSVSDRLEDAGIHQLYNADYLETNPLGRAEWIKFTAAFFGKLKEADSVFSKIEQRYLELKAQAEAADYRPSVMTGVVYGETWFLPGGNNYGAAFFKDAGGKYLWEDSDENGWLELSFESVYEIAASAEFWIGTASFSTVADLLTQEKRYELFTPVKTGNVYNYDRQLNPAGGNNYLEEGYSRPDLVLADLIHILHPELLPTHQLYFYRKLP